jgi:hypothetical protein
VEEAVTMAVTATVVLQCQSKVRDAEGILDTGEWRHVDNSATIAMKIATMKNNLTNEDNSSIFNMSRRLEASKTNIKTTETEDNMKGHNKSGGVFKVTELKKQRTDSITKKVRQIGDKDEDRAAVAMATGGAGGMAWLESSCVLYF